jgi:hypothetical protein
MPVNLIEANKLDEVLLSTTSDAASMLEHQGTKTYGRVVVVKFHALDA